MATMTDVAVAALQSLTCLRHLDLAGCLDMTDRGQAGPALCDPIRSLATQLGVLCDHGQLYQCSSGAALSQHTACLACRCNVLQSSLQHASMGDWLLAHNTGSAMSALLVPAQLLPTSQRIDPPTTLVAGIPSEL